MKAAHVYMRLDFKQVLAMRRLVHEALRAADEDLELVEKLHDASARSIAHVSISAKRDTYQELVLKAQEARKKFYDGEYDDDEYGADGVE